MHVLSYYPSCKNCFNLAISFKFVAPVALFERRELTIKNKQQITQTRTIAVSVGSVVTKLCAMETYFLTKFYVDIKLCNRVISHTTSGIHTRSSRQSFGGLASFFFFGRDSPPVGQALLIHEVSRSLTTTHHSR